MHESERLRNKRDRDFQKRALAALEKKPGGRISAFLNSRFLIWLLSAALLTAGGAYFSQRQQCNSQANQVIEKRKHLAGEMDGRRREIARLIAAATTVEQIKNGLETLPNTYPDLKARSLSDITAEFASLNQYIDESKVSDFETAASQKIEPVTMAQFAKYHSIFMGTLKSGDYNLIELKDFVRKYFEGDRIRSLVHRLSEFQPDCSLRTIASNAFKGEALGRVIQTSMMDTEFIKEIYKNPDLAWFDVELGPALRPPFVKFEKEAPSAQGP